MIIMLYDIIMICPGNVKMTEVLAYMKFMIYDIIGRKIPINSSQILITFY